MTPVKLVAATSSVKAPVLDALDIAGRSVNQQGHIRLTEAQYRKAYAAIR